MYCFYILSAFTSVMSFSHSNTPGRDGSIWDNAPFIQMEKLAGGLKSAPNSALLASGHSHCPSKSQDHVRVQYISWCLEK